MQRNIEVIEHAWRNSGPERRRKLVATLASAFKLQAGAPPVPVWRTLEELAAPLLAGSAAF